MCRVFMPRPAFLKRFVLKGAPASSALLTILEESRKRFLRSTFLSREEWGRLPQTLIAPPVFKLVLKPAFFALTGGLYFVYITRHSNLADPFLSSSARVALSNYAPGRVVRSCRTYGASIVEFSVSC
jgi:hypothetical protein